MRAVAEGAGVTPGAIYRHFRGKDALIDRIVRDAFERFELSLLKAIAPHPVGSFERIVAMGEAYIRFAQKHEEEFKVLFSPFLRKPRRVDELPGQGGYRILRQCIEEAMASGQIRSADPDLAAFYLYSRVLGIIMLMLAIDFRDEIQGEEELTALYLFEATRIFVAEGLKTRE
jgi:AcrR family transcriptional regulator